MGDGIGVGNVEDRKGLQRRVKGRVQKEYGSLGKKYGSCD